MLTRWPASEDRRAQLRTASAKSPRTTCTVASVSQACALPGSVRTTVCRSRIASAKRWFDCSSVARRSNTGTGGVASYHQGANAGNQPCEQPGETIHPQVELESEFRNPGCLELNYAAIDDTWVERDHQDESQQGDASGQVCLCIPGIRPKQNGQTTPCKRECQERNQQHFGGDHDLRPLPQLRVWFHLS